MVEKKRKFLPKLFLLRGKNQEVILPRSVLHRTNQTAHRTSTLVELAEVLISNSQQTLELSKLETFQVQNDRFSSASKNCKIDKVIRCYQ